MRRTLLWILALGAMLAASYAWYFFSERQRIAELNQRELGRAAENLRNVLENAATTVANLSVKPDFTCRFLSRQRYLLMPAGKDCVAYAGAGKRETAQARIFVDDAGISIAVEKGREFRVDLERILGELLVGDRFEYIFLTRDDGTVFFQTRRGERKRWLESLRWADRHAPSDPVNPVSTLRLQNIAQLVNRPDKKLFKDMVAITESTAVDIAGEQYRLFLQPVLVHIDDSPEHKGNDEAPHSIVLGGLVRARTSMAAALAVEPRFALALALLAGLAVLAWPLLKLVALAPCERFKATDFNLLLLSGSALLGVCSIVVLDLDNSWRVATFGADRLQSIAEDRAGSLTAEISEAVEQIADYDAAAASSQIQCDAYIERTSMLSPRIGTQLDLDAPKRYKDLGSVFWVRSDGRQIAKATLASENTPPVQVANRSYFTEAAAGRLWVLRSDEHRRGFFIQNYRSITTGDFETGISMPSAVACAGKGTNDRSVVVLTTTLRALTPKALPPDYGFMMIDRVGRVLYHSDPRRALREDLFEEISQPARLRAILTADRAERFTTNYRSGPHEMYIRPLTEIRVLPQNVESLASREADSNGWFLVSFRELQLLRTATTEAAFSSLVWYGLYFLTVQFVPALVLIIRAPKRNGWVWPDRRKLPVYQRLAVKLALITPVAIVGVMYADEWSLLAISCIIGAGAMALVFFEYRKGASAEPVHSWTGFICRWLPERGARLASMTLALILVSSAPAAGLFKFAWNQEFGAVAALESRHIAERTRDLRADIVDRAREQFASAYPGHWHEVLKEYLQTRLQAVSSGFPPDKVPADGPPDVLSKWRPLYNDASVALRYQGVKRDLRSNGHDLSMTPGLASVFGFLVLVIAVGKWIGHWDRHLLLSDLAEPGPPADLLEKIRAAWKKGLNLIIITTSQAQERSIRKLLLRPSAHAAIATGRYAAEVPEALQRQREPLNLTEALSSEADRAAVLAEMEQIAARGNGLVFSRTDPSELLFDSRRSSAAPAGGAPPSNRAESNWEHCRWNDVLQRFTVVLLPPDGTFEEAGELKLAPADSVRSDAFHRSLWDNCSDPEKLVLIHVAEEGLANPKQRRITERLLRRGLLKTAPELKPFNSDFGRFIREAYTPSTIAKWERSDAGVGWRQTRWLLALFFVTIALFLAATQREALNPLIGLIPGLVGAVTAILRLVSDLSARKQQAAT